MLTRTFLAAFAAVAIALAVISTMATGQGKKGDAAAAALHFTGKVIDVTTASDTESSMALEKFELRRIADGEYLVGKAVDDGDPDTWYKGQTVWIALDDISEIVEFSDVEAYKKATPKPAP
jgi:hypothetical protein